MSASGKTLREQEDTTVISAHKRPQGSPVCDKKKYEEMYQESISNPESFWAKQAETITWIKKWDKVRDISFGEDVHIKWYDGAQLNVCYNCVDRHLPARGNQTALIWEGDDPAKSKTITYNELFKEVCRFANVLKAQEVKKGDFVTIYMPMIPEAIYAMLACARIGAPHNVVFGGFSPEALKGRIENCGSKLVITADESVRGGKSIPLKANTDKAVSEMKDVKVLVVKNTGGKIEWNAKNNIWYHEAVKNVADTCEPEIMDAEDPLFILYTSGSTGKPKGLLHTCGGYLVYCAMTHKYAFDYHDGDIYWCTADIGWVTGHSYIVYGPLANGAISLVFEGVPTYPDSSRFWEVVDKHKVNIFYTAPTAIRSLMGQGDDFVKKTSRKSLRILGSVGEPINPEAWLWYYNVVGNKNCPVVDTWWQTETGGFMITPLPYATDLKPGSATFPFFGIRPSIVDSTSGKELTGEAEGALCINDSWPGQARTVFGDHKRFYETYFQQYKGRYFTGDGARRDKDGYYWITGRMDDVIKVSGHRIGTADVESALVANHKVAEAAAVGYPHEIKGQGIYVYVTLKEGIKEREELRKELLDWVRQQVGSFAKPDFLQFTPGLPKTRSGKIMRRILRKIAENNYGDLGDTNTLLNPEVVEYLIKNRLNK